MKLIGTAHDASDIAAHPMMSEVKPSGGVFKCPRCDYPVPHSHDGEPHL